MLADGELPAFNLSLVSQFGPSIAAVFLISSIYGKKGLIRTLKSMTGLRVGLVWIVTALAFEPVMFATITLAYWFTYKTFPISNEISVFTQFIAFSGTFLLGLFRWGCSEEIGWRGWLLPKLQDKMSPFYATLILAVIVSLWHIDVTALPDLFTPRPAAFLYGFYPAIVERLIVTIPLAMVLTYIFNHTKGSLLIMMIFHSASNTSYFQIEDLFGIVLTDFFRVSFTFFVVLLGLIFGSLVLRQRKKVCFFSTAKRST